MSKQMIDECFRARMDALCGRFPMKTFREQFVKQYAEHGLVLIQGKGYDFRGERLMVVDSECGIIFSEQRFVNIAVKLCQKWGFKVERNEHKNSLGDDMPAYSVTIPDDYLRNRMSSEAIGRMHTRDRSIEHSNKPDAKKYRKRNKR